MKKQTHVAFIAPASFDIFCPSCNFRANSCVPAQPNDSVVTVRPLRTGYYARWIGVCPKCRVRIEMHLREISASAEWTERVLVDP